MQNHETTPQNNQNKVVLIVIIILAVATAIGYFLYTGGEKEPVTGTNLMMSTIVTQTAYDKKTKKSQSLVDDSFSQLKDFENSFSMYVSDSEISQINNSAGKGMVQVSDTTYNLLMECVKYGEISDGRFDITIAPVTLAWGINSDNPTIPSDDRLVELSELVNYRDIIFDDTTKSVGLKYEGMKIDLGAIAKGAACDIVVNTYNQNPLQGYILSIGGNVVVMGQPSKQKDYFSVGIRNPRGEQNDLLGVVEITDKIVSTSGDYERFFIEDGIRYHHIFDTATAYPAQTDLISVSIIADNGAYAEFLSTYLFVMGKQYVFDIMENKTNTDYEFIVVDSDLNVYTSHGVKDIFIPNSKLSEFNFIDLSTKSGESVG